MQICTALDILSVQSQLLFLLFDDKTITCPLIRDIRGVLSQLLTDLNEFHAPSR